MKANRQCDRPCWLFHQNTPTHERIKQTSIERYSFITISAQRAHNISAPSTCFTDPLQEEPSSKDRKFSLEKKRGGLQR
jgi:hypothetical protein